VCEYISHTIQLAPQKLSAEPINSASAEALAVARSQKTKGGIEGEDPAAAVFCCLVASTLQTRI